MGPLWREYASFRDCLYRLSLNRRDYLDQSVHYSASSPKIGWLQDMRGKVYLSAESYVEPTRFLLTTNLGLSFFSGTV